ncbi:MAG: leucine--tRNA ligase [Candidatus Woesearchaeota archaeon]
MAVQESKGIDLNEISKKWQAEWEKHQVFRVSEDPAKKKYYVLEMFPYPSASFLHMGHVRNYTIGDVFARFKRMNGFNVLYPMGYDSFGLPAENAAKKSGIHPAEYTKKAIEKIMEYQKALGNSYDWSRVISTCDPEYYKWNQLFFLKMLERGLAYRKKAPVNWCPQCESVLANEEAEGGKCWRCGTEVVKKELEQWFMKTTAYAQELLDGLEELEWPEKIKKMQSDWIGRSEGVEINFKINGKAWPVFTTRIDTIFGVTFMVVAADHPGLMQICTPEHKKEVEEFVKRCRRALSEDEKALLEKDGVFTGAYAENPITGEKIPVYAGNFVIADYGSGMVMAVPAHDQRDYDFAKKFNIPIKQVITGPGADISERAYTEYGTLINSGEFSGLSSEEAIQRLADLAEKRGIGRRVVNYKIRDWLISRQRYWGTPIPVIHCPKCGIVPVPEEELPVLLPKEVDFTARENPLLSNKEFVNVKCPKCGSNAKRETDTMGGFVDSSWYFLRFCSPKEKDKPFSEEAVRYWMPVDQYIGGAEHAVMHLIYARFFTRVLRDLGYVNFSEPFKRLFNQGIVYKDGHKMSKSFGNVVFQTEISEKYGIDTARLFLMFVAAPDKQMEWSDNGVEGSYRVILRMFALSDKIRENATARDEHRINTTIKEVTEAVSNFDYPRAIISIIKAIDYYTARGIPRKHYEELLKMFSIFCPHSAEELWHRIGKNTFISLEEWPKFDEKKINPSIEELEDRTEKAKEDIRAVLKLVREKTGKEPKKATLITAESWKYRVVTKIYEELQKTRNQGEIIRNTLTLKEAEQHKNEIAPLTNRLLKNPQLLPRAEITQQQELQFLNEEAPLLQKEFGIEITITTAEKSASAPAEKKAQALPGKPAVIVE